MNYYNKETHPDQKHFLNEDSEALLNDVQPKLAEVVRRAAAISDIEIQVIHGKRTTEEQDEFFRKGVTQSGAHSAHLYGAAVDIVPVVEGRISPEFEVYDEVAMCMKYAAEDLEVGIRWGGAWHCDDLTQYHGLLEDLQNWYVQWCAENGTRLHLDPHHFELAT